MVTWTSDVAITTTSKLASKNPRRTVIASTRGNAFRTAKTKNGSGPLRTSTDPSTDPSTEPSTDPSTGESVRNTNVAVRPRAAMFRMSVVRTPGKHWYWRTDRAYGDLRSSGWRMSALVRDV